MNNSGYFLNSILLTIFTTSSKVVKPNSIQEATTKFQVLSNPNFSTAITRSLSQDKTDVFLLIDSTP